MKSKPDLPKQAKKHIAGLFVLPVFFIYLLCIYSHTMHNILSYDELKPDCRFHSIETNEEAKDKEEKPKWHIIINLDEFLMYVFREGTLIKKYPCSGGKPETPTPTGEYMIIEKSSWGEGFGGAWLGLNVPWGKYGIHGTRFPWVIGRYHASKGCIRMLSKDAKELARMAPYGTPVTIIQEKRVFRELKSGDIGSDVLAAEQALKDLGYYEGGLDGKFGKKLFEAVVNFQKDNGIRASGVVNKKTYETLMEQQNR